MNERYTIEEFSRGVSVEEYLALFHDPEVVSGYCRECSKYGKQWSCPPFDFDVVERLSKYRNVELIATKIILLDSTIAPSEIGNVLRPERIRLEERLLAMESRYKGLASTYVGECLHCAKVCCSRLEGKPCRHPDLVRPSLEAYGFDVTKTISELFGLTLKWGTKDSLPEYLILVCALFHNTDKVQW